MASPAYGNWANAPADSSHPATSSFSGNYQNGNSTQASQSALPSLYAATSQVPLIKDPSLRVPPPIPAPKDLHPLPPRLEDYFVYPFTLEQFVLEQREKREKLKREELRKVAPGWTSGQTLLPDSARSKNVPLPAERGPMDDLVDHLAALDAAATAGDRQASHSH